VNPYEAQLVFNFLYGFFGASILWNVYWGRQLKKLVGK